MIRQRVNAGLKHVRAQGRRLARATIDGGKEHAIRKAIVKGDKGLRKNAAELKVSTGAVLRIKAEMGSARV